VAVDTVPEAKVIEPVLPPVGGIVAVGAQGAVVIALPMATCALGIARMIERDIVPVLGIVAVEAGPLEMLACELVFVAVEASVETVVVKRDLFPAGSVMADRTLARIVRPLSFLHRVARLAIGKDRVIKGGPFPTIDVVAVGALAGIVIFGAVILQVTGPAVVKAGMVKGGIHPFGGIAVAIHAGARISPHCKRRVPH
jgi:hypothetical protein